MSNYGLIWINMAYHVTESNIIPCTVKKPLLIMQWWVNKYKYNL